ncbi:hypothetical protein [Kocuria varians]|uniref:Uncharacterized protein n=1 Tax=Kocuria varians TaxID=1272 RepID=A0A7D7KX79_KOCVA|nr:hypothetical protein [Kocuria varians]QMS55490.1 hypothetical protein CIB50_0000174 [Kocuria varians]
MKYLPGILSLSCTIASLLIFFLAREPMLAMLVALLGVVASGATTFRRRPGGGSNPRTDRGDGHTVELQRRRLLADVQAHQRNVAHGGAPAASH